MFEQLVVSIPYRQCLSETISELKKMVEPLFQFLIGNVLAYTLEEAYAELLTSFNSL